MLSNYHMPTIIKWLATGTLVLLYLFIFYIGYLIFWPVRTLEVKNHVLPILTHRVKAGSAMVYQLDYCRYDFFGATVYRTLYGTKNNVVYPLAVVNTVTFPGCRVADVYLMIPASLTPGTYYVEILERVQVNLLKETTLESRTESFQVIN